MNLLLPKLHFYSIVYDKNPFDLYYNFHAYDSVKVFIMKSAIINLRGVE